MKAKFDSWPLGFILPGDTLDSAIPTFAGAVDLFRITEDHAAALVEAAADEPELARALVDLSWAIRLNNIEEHVKAVGRITDIVMAANGGEA